MLHEFNRVLPALQRACALEYKYGHILVIIEWIPEASRRFVEFSLGLKLGLVVSRMHDVHTYKIEMSIRNFKTILFFEILYIFACQ